MSEDKAKNSFAITAWIGGILFIIGTIFASGSNYERLNDVEKRVDNMQDLQAKVEVLNSLLPRLEKQLNDLQNKLNERK